MWAGLLILLCVGAAFALKADCGNGPIFGDNWEQGVVLADCVYEFYFPPGADYFSHWSHYHPAVTISVYNGVGSELTAACYARELCNIDVPIDRHSGTVVFVSRDAVSDGYAAYPVERPVTVLRRDRSRGARPGSYPEMPPMPDMVDVGHPAWQGYLCAGFSYHYEFNAVNGLAMWFFPRQNVTLHVKQGRETLYNMSGDWFVGTVSSYDALTLFLVKRGLMRNKRTCSPENKHTAEAPIEVNIIVPTTSPGCLQPFEFQFAPAVDWEDVLAAPA